MNLLDHSCTLFYCCTVQFNPLLISTWTKALCLSTIQAFLPSDMRCSASFILIPSWTLAHFSRVYLSYHSGVPAEQHDVFYKCYPDPYLSLLLKSIPFYHSGVPAERHEVFYECCPDPYLDKSLLLKSIPFLPFSRSC